MSKKCGISARALCFSPLEMLHNWPQKRPWLKALSPVCTLGTFLKFDLKVVGVAQPFKLWARARLCKGPGRRAGITDFSRVYEEFLADLASNKNNRLVCSRGSAIPAMTELTRFETTNAKAKHTLRACSLHNGNDSKQMPLPLADTLERECISGCNYIVGGYSELLSCQFSNL
ncbi:hypothetical protein TNCV_5022971 [Trichonephila clavipes]|nr:hypothetical protein TNCV_5022971 [Trichonephila clavipes]